MRFKYGRVYLDRDHEIADFERALGYQLPESFLELIGKHCEGGFDGHWQIALENGIEVQWHHLLLMKLAEDQDLGKYDARGLILAKPALFGDVGHLKRFPFGEARLLRPTNQRTIGHLAFDCARDGTVVFVSAADERRVDVADSFRQMMRRASFVFYG